MHACYMLLAVLGTVCAVIFRDSRSKRFLAKSDRGLFMTPYPEEALDISLQETELDTVSVVLSLGTTALKVNKRSKNIDFGKVNRRDRDQFFKLDLTPGGSFIFQHKDLCLGNMPGIRLESNATLGLIDCQDRQNLVSFFKSDRIDGQVRKKIVAYYDPNPSSDVPAYINEPKIDVEKAEDGVVRPEETGFLRGLYNRVTHPY
ncbi:uncharacterized protein VICG_00748 [Vittaforma corneae ATCC 50505]|uniref:Ricin B lectin domain-containing protein n=1 Tax=Vittaforma corneae (strain ATCC 50505) TaxID=993615 RepID=L2GP83_VITCO|nr:uncharacterized protein VICG_00748 [Vittaforma corneae ATCC 50505]ELA42107.1 hypothetical protein VICG_00748 [Vittaforma corneae ATCC 50505]